MPVESSHGRGATRNTTPARFNLKERVTTLITLPPELQGSAAALALHEDVFRRTAALEVAEKIQVRAPRFSWAPARP